ncbi:hypothetical protein DL770_011993 [Monosporascus sp. CRB-9-2]|nr:hypothetical protein DL770_011993 [Monosporascus sp. CRB-9-2]
MASVHRIGFTQLPVQNGAKDRYRVNIIFVHGLRGHPRHTWEDKRGVSSEETGTVTSSKRKTLTSFFRSKPSASTAGTAKEKLSNKVFWPDEYLTEDLPDARVWTYGYNADAINGLFQANNKNSVSQHGQDLQVQIERDIDNEDPIMSDTCRMRTKLIIFLGTPHRGSSSAGWGEIMANLARLSLQDSNKEIVKTLEVNSELLNNINEQFQPVVPEFGIRIHSFQEARGITGMKGLHNKVVDDFSSKLDLRPFETVESVDTNHMQMARCSDKTDEQYRKIVGVLKQFMRKELGHKNRIMLQILPSTTTGAETQTAAGELSEHSINRAALPCHYIPFAKNKRFVGRDSTLERLTEMLFIGKECQKVAVFGLGGVGKTQVALQLAYWAKDYSHRPKYSVFWVSAMSGPAFEQAYTEIARKLPIKKSSETEDPKESVRRYLSSDAAGLWLLIVDNADNADILFGNSDICGITEYLPESESGLTLFTTRSRDIALSVAGGEMVELHEMSLQEAKSIFEKSLVQKDLVNDTATTELMDELTYLPLAITQAAAYLNRNEISIAEYLRLLRGTEKDTISLISREFYDNTRYKGSQNAVATTWLVSFDQIHKSDSAAANLLSFISCIEPKAIPRSILPNLGSEEQMVKEAMELLEHIVTIQETTLTKDHPYQLASQHTLAIAYEANGQVKEAIELLEHVVAIEETTLAKDHPDRLASQHELASAYKTNGQVKEAIELLEHIVAIQEITFTKDHPNRLASQHELATAYKTNGQVKEAIELLEHVVAIKETTLAKNHPDRLASQHELASAYKTNGQVKEAIELLEHVVAIKETTLTKDHPNRLASQHELASAYKTNGQVKKAIELLEHIVTIKETTLTKNHPDRLTSQHELANAYEANGQVKEAIKLLEHIVAIQKITLTKDHPYQLASQHALAIAYEANGQVKEAIKLVEHVVAIRKITLTKDHPYRLASQHALAIAYEANGQVKEAIELLEHLRLHLGATHKVARHLRRLRSRKRPQQRSKAEAVMVGLYIIVVDAVNVADLEGWRTRWHTKNNSIYSLIGARGAVYSAVYSAIYNAASKTSLLLRTSPSA